MSRRETLRHPEDPAAKGMAYCRGHLPGGSESDRECKNCARERDVDRPEREKRKGWSQEREARREAERTKHLAEQASKDIAARTVKCPWCEAESGAPCVRANKSALAWSHGMRWNALRVSIETWAKIALWNEWTRKIKAGGAEARQKR